MAPKKGIIALMGSGELTATMVEVHKELLSTLVKTRHAVFLDSPAGFQLNVDQLSQKAVEYFRTHIQQPVSIASFKSKDTITPYEAEQAFHTLREADFILIGPGSPSYAVRQWLQTPIPEILMNRAENGGRLIAASAAALTMGRFTLPIYEIYKVGEDLHWVEGANILGHFGFNLVVVPHWNNAEGGTHDTRFCYMGEPRFRKLESLLPEDVAIFGLDEHTACLMDLEKDEAEIKGIGRVTLRHHGAEMIFEKGDRFSLEVLRGADVGKDWKPTTADPAHGEPVPSKEEKTLWDEIHTVEKAFHTGLEKHDPKKTTNALLELDRLIWQSQLNRESDELISEARDILRELIVLLGMRLEASPNNKADGIAPLVEKLLELRDNFRNKKQWAEADEIRESLDRTNIIIEDSKEGPRWRLKA